MSYISPRKHGQRSHVVPVSNVVSQPSAFFTMNAPTQSVCIICNTNYWSTMDPSGSCSTSTARILSFCDSFGVKENSEREELLRLSSLTDPFCTGCAHKINQLQEWTAQLELLQKGIQVVKTEVGQLMLHSLPDSTQNRGIYPILARVVRSKKINFFY